MPFVSPLYFRFAITFVSILTVILAMQCSELGFAADPIDQNTSPQYKRALEEMTEAMKKRSIERESNTFEKAVDRCLQNVRNEQPYSRFDAYIGEGMAVNSFGTEEENFKFNKCMAKSGHPLRPPK